MYPAQLFLVLLLQFHRFPDDLVYLPEHIFNVLLFFQGIIQMFYSIKIRAFTKLVQGLRLQ